MTLRNALLLSSLLLAPLAFADPDILGVPNTECQTPDEWRLHDYGPSLERVRGLPTADFYHPDRYTEDTYPDVEDGNLADCVQQSNYVLYAPYVHRWWYCEEFEEIPPVANFCYGNRPADFDGDMEFGRGGAVLAARSGSGWSPPSSGVWNGSILCWGIVAHHPEGGRVRVEDLVLGGLVSFSVSADHSFYDIPHIIPQPGGDHIEWDCGDGVIQPCPPPLAPSALLPPVGTVADIIASIVDASFTSAGLCNDLDRQIHCFTVCDVPFAAGTDGTYVVHVYSDLQGNEGVPTGATQGHIDTWGHP